MIFASKSISAIQYLDDRTKGSRLNLIINKNLKDIYKSQDILNEMLKHYTDMFNNHDIEINYHDMIGILDSIVNDTNKIEKGD